MMITWEEERGVKWAFHSSMAESKHSAPYCTTASFFFIKEKN